MRLRNALLPALAVLLLIVPLIVRRDADWEGADQKAAKLTNIAVVTELPWRPPSPEIESGLFAAQAALGAGVIGYLVGRSHGLKRGRS